MPTYKITVRWNREWSEWTVRLYRDGAEIASYHTDDKADAEATGREMLRTASAGCA